MTNYLDWQARRRPSPALPRKAGYVLLARNYRDGSREIDLFWWDGDTIVFTEVKARSGIGFGTPRSSWAVKNTVS
jgi:Holliday junction resolvase-like predicted endonuclease